MREQYPLTLNALYFRFWTPGKGHFLDEVLKNILCGRLRVVARWAAPWRDREAFVNAAGIKACCIRYAKDGTACLVPKKLVVFDNEDEIQTLLDSGQVPYTDLRFAEAEAAQLWPVRRGANGDEWRGTEIVDDWIIRDETERADWLRWIKRADRHLTYDEVHTLLDKELRARLEARPDNRAGAGQGHRSELDKGGGRNRPRG